MRSLIVVSLILIFVVVVGVTIRGTVFRKYLPEGFEDSAGSSGDSGEKKQDEKKESENGGEAVQVDTKSGMKNFMEELGGNKGAMKNISSDTKAMIENQKELMEMMKNVQPALTQGMEFMKSFKGMMGNN
jgi:hypothetical protein